MACAALMATATIEAKQPRSSSAIAAFKRHNPCPATGARRGACAGYVIDHIIPLCAGGPDKLTNMQWQTRSDSLIKDRAERRQCRILRAQA
jgi:hypothetical protein